MAVLIGGVLANQGGVREGGILCALCKTVVLCSIYVYLKVDKNSATPTVKYFLQNYDLALNNKSIVLFPFFL